MALRARLIPPRPARSEWAWHHAQYASVSVAKLGATDRRMEAETYLSGGYAIRNNIEGRKRGWARLDRVADVRQPARLKGTLVDPQHGTPFLAATQVFDLRPAPRKWLAEDKIKDAAALFVAPGTILVTRSGSVGRSIVAHAPHQGLLVSDDLLRVTARTANAHGWLYAYLRTRHGQAMMQCSQYGPVVKHLECAHLDAQPVPVPADAVRADIDARVRSIYEKRDAAHHLVIEAERAFETATRGPQADAADYFTVSASALFAGRRRLEGTVYNRVAAGIIRRLKGGGRSVVSLASLGVRASVPHRFKHVYGPDGVSYLDSADLLEVNPEITKFVLTMEEEEQAAFRVERGWLLMPCSGQTYGNNGTVVPATAWHENKLISNHVMRLVPSPTSGVRTGYLWCALGHPSLGRPLVTRMAFGSSVPEIAPDDMLQCPIVRLAKRDEDHIADRMERAADLRADADAMETDVVREAEELMDAFIAGKSDSFQAFTP